MIKTTIEYESLSLDVYYCVHEDKETVTLNGVDYPIDNSEIEIIKVVETITELDLTLFIDNLNKLDKIKELIR